MRILIVSLTIVFLSACGTNQTEQMSNSEPLVKQDESQAMIEKSSTEMTSSESSIANANSSVEDLKVEEGSGDVVAETTSDNGMIKDTGIQTEESQTTETQPMEAMEGNKDEIAKEKGSTDKKIVEEKG